MTLPGRSVQPSARGSLLAAALLYVVVTAYGVVNDGYHSDDWRHLTGASPLWVAVEGRWLLDLIYRDLLGERFLLPVQLLLAFPCLFGVSWLLARRAVPDGYQGPAALLIFGLGVNHPFLSDALTFASNVFAYPLALFLSVAAFVIVEESRGRSLAAQTGLAALAALVLSFSVGIYQTFAVAGLIVPVLALIRADRVPFAAAARLAGIGAVVSLAAIALYLAEWRLYAALQGVTIASERFQAAGAAGMAAKAAELPGLIRSLQTGTLMALPFVLRAAMGLLSLAALAFGAVAALRMLAGQLPGGRILGPLRVGLGLALALFVFPVLFWVAYEGDTVPARAFGYFGFWVAALLLAALTMAVTGASLRIAGMSAAALAGVIFALTASAFWSDTARSGQRDMELARAIQARIATLPGYDGGPFRLVGGVSNPDLDWGTLANWSSFHGGNPSIGIFRELYGQDHYTASLPASPRACHAFPADGSAFVLDGMAYICLEEFPAFTNDLRCAALTGAAGQSLCLGPKIMVHFGPTCLPTGPDDPALTVAFRSEGQPHAPERNFSVASFAVPLEGRCATLALAPASPRLSTLEVSLRGVDGAPVWRQDIAVPAMTAP